MKNKEISESTMADAFEKCLRTSHGFAGFPVFDSVFREVTCKQGVADFIAGISPKLREKDIKRISGTLLQFGTEGTIRILSLLKCPHTKDYIIKTSGFSEGMVNRTLLRLIKEEIIKQNKNGSFLISSKWQLPEIELWAFELKVNDWKRALFQALQYKAFASRVVTVFPKEREKVLRANLDKFKRMRVGIIIFDANDKTSKILLRPPKNRPSSHMHHLIASSRIALLEEKK